MFNEKESEIIFPYLKHVLCVMFKGFCIGGLVAVFLFYFVFNR